MSTKVKTITVTNESTSTTTSIPAAVSQIYYNDKNNLNIATDSTDVGTDGKGGKINIESASDIQFKPGDDIIFYSHHRPTGSLNEVAVKVTDGDDKPVKLLVNASEMTLTTKDKTGDDASVFDITVNSAKSTRGYLKVRAQAIDLRSESHGGIALQPKGFDGSATDTDKTSGEHMNKIKFEHGGGDGLEFGTFNTKKTSIFTDEYRFNKNGIVKMATRTLLDNSAKTTNNGDDGKGNGKKDVNDPTTYYSYKKQSDDFYDIISTSDDTTTWKDIIKTSSAFNKTVLDKDNASKKVCETELTNSNNIRIKTTSYYKDADTEVIPDIILEPAGNIKLNSNTITKKGKQLTSTYTDDTTITCDFYDIVKLVNYCKQYKYGPWAKVSGSSEILTVAFNQYIVPADPDIPQLEGDL